jgi:hypothetical protein
LQFVPTRHTPVDVYLTTLAVVKIALRQIVGLLINAALKLMQMELLLTYLEAHLCVCWEETEEYRENYTQESWYLGQDWKG